MRTPLLAIAAISLALCATHAANVGASRSMRNAVSVFDACSQLVRFPPLRDAGDTTTLTAQKNFVAVCCARQGSSCYAIQQQPPLYDSFNVCS
jgi:hypothetical protein